MDLTPVVVNPPAEIGKTVVVLSEDVLGQVSSLVSEAAEITVINDDADLGQANGCYKAMNTLEKGIQKGRKEITAPIEAFKKQIIAAANGTVTRLNVARDNLGLVIVRYQNEQHRKKEEERKIREAKEQKEREDRARQQALADKGKDFPPAPEPEKPKEMVPAKPAVKSAIRTVKRQVVTIVDEEQIPRSYLEPDMVAIRKDLLAGKDVPGCLLETKETVEANR